MTENQPDPDEGADPEMGVPRPTLRPWAEAKVTAVEAQTPAGQSPEEIQQMLHELRTHQAKLEMQIDELRRTQVELEASRARYLDLFDLAPVGYVTLNEAGLILDANLTAAIMLGVERGALVRQPLTHFILPDDQDLYSQLCNRLLETGTPQVCELQMRRIGASPFWARVETTAAQAPSTGSEPATNGVRVFRIVISDITVRRQTEEALRESEEHFRQLAENMVDLVARLDAHAVFEFASPSYEKVLGYHPVELIGQLVTELMHPDDRQPAIQAMGAMLRLGAGAIQFRYRHKDGSYRWFESTGRPIVDTSGQATGFVLGSRDITERKLAEETLRESELRFRAFIEQAPVAISVSRDGINFYANQKLLEMVGLQRADESVGWPVDKYLTPQYREDYQERRRRQAHGPAVPFEVEAVGFRSDGSQFPFLAMASQVQLSDGPAVVAFVTDLTERRRAQARLQEMEVHMQVLHEMDRLRAELIGNVSHELRTPLGLILMMVAMLRRERLYANPEVRDRFLHDIEEEARHLQGIVDQLLDESRLQSGRLALDRRAEDVRALIRRTVELQAVQAPQHRLSHQLPEAALSAEVDAPRIEQVLRNLLDNAVKYSPAGGAITVWAGAEAESVRIAVGDEGPGIPPAERERIFERFYRIVDPQASPIAGLGLGLSICRGIVEAHGGRLWVEERPGGGSLFVFTLPKGSEHAAPAHERRGPIGDRRKPAARDKS